ncbi:hypothetical protein [Nocardia wallacei]|uniref:hypothetical protein n=1 Tax=Nocardia wallacei TaxID=480035 RepID=UPI0024540B0B|nr:hypothetical protein [Nocardia wallacei]
MRVVARAWERLRTLAGAVFGHDRGDRPDRRLRVVPPPDLGHEHSSLTADRRSRPRGEAESSPRGLGGMDI